MKGWISRGKLSSRLAGIGVIVLLVHLSGAGGIGNHGVAATLWVLMALGLNIADRFNGARRISQTMAISIVVGVMILTVVCQRTAYSPVVKSKSALAAALSANWNPDAFDFDAIDKLREAAAWDPLATEPQRRITMSSGNASEFEAAAAQWIRNAPDRFSTYRDLGSVYRRLHRSDDADRRFLNRAIEAYRQAVRCYPHSAILQAHLAWTLHLGGDATAAQAAAADALRLDDLNPHADQKLDSGNFPFADPDVAPKSIRQRMQQLVDIGATRL
jgi:tetratricopeptide (TPR) repeat protein